MDTNKMREQFESWAISEGLSLSARYGTYFHESTQKAWLSWQASREAVVVEMPVTDKPAPEDDKRWHGVRNSTIGACRRAIEAQGLKVVP